MEKNRILIIGVLLQLIFINHLKSQEGIFIRQISNVIFGSNTWDKDLLIKEKCTSLCLGYLDTYYSKNKLPNIYLAISSKEDLTKYELAYDNLHGNSLENKLYKRRCNYDMPGIRIVIYSKELKELTVLKLLDYGINNLPRLKRIRRNALKIDYYDQPNNLSLSKNEIDSVLKSPVKREIVMFLDSNK